MRDILIKEVVRVDPLKVFHFVKDLSQRSHLMCSVKKDILKIALYSLENICDGAEQVNIYWVDSQRT